MPCARLFGETVLELLLSFVSRPLDLSQTMAHAGPSRLARLTTVPMDDLLFEERLDVFLLKNLKDVRDFAAREGRPEDEVCVLLNL